MRRAALRTTITSTKMASAPVNPPLIARVQNGRLVLDVPTDLPEGAEIEVYVDDEQELLAELDASLEESERDDVVSADVVIAELRARSAS
jgi:hypothetical protein